jgi:hypothetical protein
MTQYECIQCLSWSYNRICLYVNSVDFVVYISVESTSHQSLKKFALIHKIRQAYILTHKQKSKTAGENSAVH